MLVDFRDVIQQYSQEPLTRQVLLSLLKEYKRPYDKIHELMKAGDLIQVKRGVYVTGPRITIDKPDNLLLANHLLGPSYVSLETALSHWGLIPERVYETSSITLKNSKIYKTPVGRFTYIHASLPYYAFGVKSVQLTKKQVVLMASPEKALCDKIVMTGGLFLRSIRQTRDFLTEDMRMEVEQIRTFRIQDIRSWVNNAPKSSSLLMLTKTLEQL